jgi:hypothetical protein
MAALLFSSCRTFILLFLFGGAIIMPPVLPLCRLLLLELEELRPEVGGGIMIPPLELKGDKSLICKTSFQSQFCYVLYFERAKQI